MQMPSFVIGNKALCARFIALGAALVELRLAGWPRSLVLGFLRREDYAATDHYAGGVIGRYANRIENGRAVIDGHPIELSRNGSGHHLHGGETGLARKEWVVIERRATQLALECASADGHEGYPGNCRFLVRYEILPPATLRLTFEAVSDRSTLINMCQHPYFNFSGAPDVFEHLLAIDAETYLPSDDDLIPTGEIRPVAGTAFEFRTPRKVGAHRPAPGFNNTFCLSHEQSGPLRRAARLSVDDGPHMELWTTQPGLHLYDGYKLQSGLVGLDGALYGPCGGLCLEAQAWPDSPNNRLFPSAILRPGETYRQVTEYRFERRKSQA